VDPRRSLALLGAGPGRGGPLVSAEHGVEAPDLGFVRVEDRGAVEFLLRLAR
jgi:hypothetical protein